MELKMLLSKVIRKSGYMLINVANRVSSRQESTDAPEQDPEKMQFERTVSEWFAQNGDKTLRVNYDLTPESIVFDVGGYEGQWASDIFAMYYPRIFVFEPVEGFAKKIKERFSRNHRISVYPVGLSSKPSESNIFVQKDGSSIFRGSGKVEKIKLVAALDFFQEHHINHIDLMKINIEGGEYELLEHLIDAGLVEKIDNIQVQFHTVVDNYLSRMKDIQAALSKTHQLTYQFPLVWENWRLKSK